MADSESARIFAAQALALRTAGTIGIVPAQEFLEAMPGSGLASEVPLRFLWTSFFKNSIMKLGRLNSSSPIALYYNPLLDIGVLAYWQKQEDGYHISTIRATPGERISYSDASVSLQPSWMRAENPVGELSATTKTRLDAFRLANPAKSQDAARNTVSFAAAANDMRVVLSRLALDAEMRTSWTEDDMPWLFRALEEVEKALTARDPDILMSVSPDTNKETVAALSSLPPGYAENLTLDAALRAGDVHRLLIGSSPEDGDIYVLVLCRLTSAELCELQRFELISLVE